MSQLANELFKGLGAIGKGTWNGFVNEFLPEVGAELGRQGSRGSMELANALFNGNAFVLYGPGQEMPQPNREAATESAQPQEQEKTQETGRDGMSR